MKTLPFGSWCRVAWAVALLAGVFVFTGNIARAGCGDHVLILSHDDSGPPTPHKLPCHGPGCSNAPTDGQVPLTAGIPPTESLIKPTCYQHSSAAVAGDDSASRSIPSSNGRPVRRPSAIFHPPRVG